MPPSSISSEGTPVSTGHAARSIASTKLVPPRGARRLMPREALLARLLDARRQRCVVVQGPAGSGKTSTLVAWRQALLSLDFDVAWLSLGAEDNEPTRFFDCLLASLAEVDARMVRNAALLTGRDSEDSAIEHWVVTLVNSIASRKRELVLMLDDLQHMDDPRIIEALQCLLDYAPPQLHLVVGSRSALPLSLSRLRAQGLLSEFDLRDLRFTAAESERFLLGQLGKVDKRDAEVLHELTDGWIAGLQLFVLDLKTKQGAQYARMEVRDARAFASYFEREVLLRLAQDDLDLLTRISICNRFCAPLCAALLGLPHAVARVTTRLAHLDRDNLFISQISARDRETWYRLHPLLREVLQARLAAAPEAERHALHAAAWRWFEQHGHVDEAVRHAVQAGEPQAAADLVEACAHDLYVQGELSQVAALLRRLPPSQVDTRFSLRLLLAHLRMYARDLEAVAQTIDQLEAAAARGELDIGQRYALTMLRAGLALQRDDADAMLALLPELQRVPADADDLTLAGRSNVLSWMYMYRGEYAMARKVLEDEGWREGAPRTSLVGRCLGGMSHALEGDIVRAERIFRDALQEAEKYGAAFIGVACMAAGLLGDAMYELNEIDAARRMLEERIEVLERISIPDSVYRALLILASAHWRAGRHLEARAYLDRLEDYATAHSLDRLLAHALGSRLRWHLQQGEPDQAEAVLARLGALDERYADAARGPAWETTFAARRARIDMCVHRKDFEAALAQLVPLISMAEAGGRWRRVASLRMQLALVEQACGRPRSASENFLQAVRLGHRLGLLRTLLDVSSRVPERLDALLQEKVLDPALTFYVQRLLAAAAQTVDEPAARPPARLAGVMTTLTEREAEVVELLAQAMPNKKIARALNVTPETVKWHLKNIYGKLNVAGRDEAVARLRDLAAGHSQAPARPR
ncbi:LuxR family transcriptional regulator [Cupriavidus necator]|uniref:LuxR family transcriptional regulator n=1 Tax=Cupriavidus necator TaxID=106590 RepID=A0A1U9V2I8_CUPNE|nr:LuxR C-terminal-related transcriptional regulator [Cupriavidus necator]AQV98595.1 LuxR family transcriptional regulator [Cupriavidus necator]